MVAASQPQAVRAGLDILEHGGAAADAAVAAAAALAVTEPCSTGLGGDAFALYYDAKTKTTHALNGAGRSAAGFTPALLKERGLQDELPVFHPLTVTVPGACAMWAALSKRFGRLPLGDVLAPGVRLAQEGFRVAPVTADLWARGVARQLTPANNGGELLLNGRAPKTGERMRNPNLAHVLKTLSKHGPEEFYAGSIAQNIAKAVQERGGVLTESDLAEHFELEPDWSAPVETTYRGVRVQECPPNGQGITALIALNILTALGESFTGAPDSPQRFHTMIEALRLAFWLTRAHVTDPDFMRLTPEDLLDENLAKDLATRIQPEKRATLKGAAPLSSSGTVYFCVVDNEGNACSMVNSNYLGFGTGIVPQGLGFSLQNRGHNFSLDPAHPNYVAPKKRPYHTIIPGMAISEDPGDEGFVMPFGVMGGFMQPQGHVQVLVNLLDHGQDPQTTLDAPRFCIPAGTQHGVVHLEDGVSPSVVSELTRYGHPVECVSGYERSVFGRGQVIVRRNGDGALMGGSDGRADGLVMGR